MTSLQAVELGLALGLVWMGLRTPAAAPRLLGASLVLGLWALLADGTLAIWRLVGLRAHGRGLLVIAAGLIVVPLAAGDLRRPVALGSCAVAAALLARLGLLRWPALEAGPGPSGVKEPSAAGQDPASPPATHGAGAARLLGRLLGRAGTIVAADVDAGIPRAARAAGRLAGRARRPPGSS